MLFAFLCASCVSFSTGGEAVEQPQQLGSRPPKIFIHYKGLSGSKLALERALDDTAAFGERVSTPEEADAVLTVLESFRSEVSAGALVNAIFLFTLPLPGIYDRYSVRASWTVEPLEPFSLPSVDRTVQYWGGIPLILFSFFITADRDDVNGELGVELAQRAHAGYAAYVERAHRAALSGGTENLAHFVDAFPGASDEAALRKQLEEQLWKAIEQNGQAADYFAYLLRYPEGLRADLARRNGREVVWKQLEGSTDLQLLTDYRRAFPDGDTEERVTLRIDEVAWTRALQSRWVGDYRLYLELLPDGPRVEQVRDALAWAQAEELGTREALHQYIDAWPGGEFRPNAQAGLALYDDPSLPKARAELARWVGELGLQRGRVTSAEELSTSGFRSIHFESEDQTRAVAQLGERHFELRRGMWWPALPRRFLQEQPVTDER